MKNKTIFGFIAILLISISFVSATFYGGYKGEGSNYASSSSNSQPIYNLRYQGPSNEPSTSYYSGDWNSGSSSSTSKVTTFNGPYTEVHRIATDSSPQSSYEPNPSSNTFGGGYGFYGGSGYGYSGGYYGGYGYSGYSLYNPYGPSYFSPTYYGTSYYDSYSNYYPGYYWTSW